MKTNTIRLIFGVGLILAGVLLFLQVLDVFYFGEIFWAIPFALAAVGFLAALANNPRGNWWAAIPGAVLLGIAGEIAVPALPAAVQPYLEGTCILFSIGLAFWLVFIVTPHQWWAIIPAGTMTALALTNALDSVLDDTGFIFLLGLAVTFALIPLLTISKGSRRHWAWFPAIALLVVGLLSIPSKIEIMPYMWGIALILAGIYLAWNALRPAK